MDDGSPPTPDQASNDPAVRPSSSSSGVEAAGFLAVLEATVLAAIGEDPRSKPPPTTR